VDSVNKTAFRADMKMIGRDPILILLMLVPIFALIFIKVLLHYLVPWLVSEFGFDLSLYYGYILGGCFLLSPMMLGTVAGFLMIDEKDGKIFELISITPTGYSGYMAHRLVLPFVGSIIYTLMTYWVLNIYTLDGITLMLIMLMLSLESVLVGVVLFLFAEDKVQGLTYSKGLGVFIILSMADLFGKAWLSILAGIIPFYWILRLIHDPKDLLVIVLAVLIHLIWVGALMKKC
jgi:fluoroquinolone transport system permease protein